MLPTALEMTQSCLAICASKDLKPCQEKSFLLSFREVDSVSCKIFAFRLGDFGKHKLFEDDRKCIL
jgi:hypothetical protein